MMKSFSEIREELKNIRRDMYKTGGTADLKLIASYLDRVVLSLEDLTETLELMDVELETACECVECKPEKKAKAAKKKSKKR
ncbi:MAG: hypothetical protein PHF60_03130 [Candidatus ainarchaeum sp.]|nr:hypothetical protein [Candidatus ainarchaeum sp.]